MSIMHVKWFWTLGAPTVWGCCGVHDAVWWSDESKCQICDSGFNSSCVGKGRVKFFHWFCLRCEEYSPA